ncbi:hypothetical protein BGZ50_009726 [Haplosporangium sp. Z 11]|nr:hypothetical protein BGZ50_009726 [Haplosporangium sp. Z 11]
MTLQDPRLSQILPVIRCSDCGHDVEFRKLGEHVCSSAPAMPALPRSLPKQQPVVKPGVSSGGYKPAHKPPPVPIGTPAPSNGNPRPSLPFLEKYAKKNKSSSPVPLLQPNDHQQQYHHHNNHQQQYQQHQQHEYSQQQQQQRQQPTHRPVSPGYANDPHQHGHQGHYQRDHQEYMTSKSPIDHQYSSTQSGRYPPGSRPKTPVYDSVNQGPARTSQPQPNLPLKSKARSPSVSSAQGNGQGYGAEPYDHHPSPPGHGDSYSHGYPVSEREREMDRINRSTPSMDSVSSSGVISSPSSVSSGFSRSGSSGSAASSILAERSIYQQRGRSNTMLSEKSEISVRSERSERSERSARSERSRHADDEREMRYNHQHHHHQAASLSTRPGDRRHHDSSSPYETPSPPVSPQDTTPSPSDTMAPPKPTPYRPITPPEVASPVPTRGRRPSVPQANRKATDDQFDALMDDLLQEINTMPTTPSPSRDTARTPRSRSRSRPNLPENGRSKYERAGSPPPTPGLPMLAAGGGGSEHARSQRSGRDREYRSERSERGERGEREARNADQERESLRDRERTNGTRSVTSRSRSTNRRGAVAYCEGCKHDIQPSESADAIKMSRGDYHPECFKCTRCRRPLESAAHAHEYEGRILCEKDYQRYMERDAQRSDRPSGRSRTAVCAGCDAPIQGETPVYALGQSWHERHLACYQCQQPIQQSVLGGHVEKNGRVYCPHDYAELFLPKCRGCGLTVEKEAVCAQDGKLKGKWHAACFGCQTCKKPFPDKSFYVFGDAPYCRRHYHKLNNSLCKGCDQPIEGPCAQTMEGWRFHPGCFSCVECKVPLTDIYYNFEDQAYCERDMMVIQRTRNVRADRRKTVFGKV